MMDHIDRYNATHNEPLNNDTTEPLYYELEPAADQSFLIESNNNLIPKFSVKNAFPEGGCCSSYYENINRSLGAVLGSSSAKTLSYQHEHIYDEPEITAHHLNYNRVNPYRSNTLHNSEFLHIYDEPDVPYLHSANVSCILQTYEDEEGYLVAQPLNTKQQAEYRDDENLRMFPQLKISFPEHHWLNKAGQNSTEAWSPSAFDMANSEANLRRIKNVEDCFGSSGQALQRQGRVLVGEGVLTKLCRKKPKPRQFFLFNDILVYGNILINRKKFNKQHILPLQEVKIIALNDEGNFTNGWQIISPSKSFAVYAATALEKQEWMAHINKSISDLLKKTGEVPSGNQAAVWVPDTVTDYCMLCNKTKFTTIVRRHHCRQCGSVVCGSCSTKKKLLEHISTKPVRVCDDCFNNISDVDKVDTSKRHSNSQKIINNETLSRKEAEKITESGSSAEESDGDNDESTVLTPTFYEKDKIDGAHHSPEPPRPAARPVGGSE